MGEYDSNAESVIDWFVRLQRCRIDSPLQRLSVKILACLEDLKIRFEYLWRGEVSIWASSPLIECLKLHAVWQGRSTVLLLAVARLPLTVEREVSTATFWSPILSRDFISRVMVVLDGRTFQGHPRNSVLSRRWRLYCSRVVYSLWRSNVGHSRTFDRCVN